MGELAVAERAHWLSARRSSDAFTSSSFHLYHPARGCALFRDPATTFNLIRVELYVCIMYVRLNLYMRVHDGWVGHG